MQFNSACFACFLARIWNIEKKKKSAQILSDILHCSEYKVNISKFIRKKYAQDLSWIDLNKASQLMLKLSYIILGCSVFRKLSQMSLIKFTPLWQSTFTCDCIPSYFADMVEAWVQQKQHLSVILEYVF